MIYLDAREYAKIVSEINTYFGKYKGKRFAIHISYGLDCKTYAYVFEIHAFNDYIFIARYEIK